MTTFSNDNNVSAYYLPGTTGWSSTFAGIPTVSLPYTCTVTTGAITIMGYAGAGGAVTIPSTIGGLPVTSIGANAFIANGSLTSLTIPDSVVNIGSGACSNCVNLANVTIGDSVTNVSTQAFYSCTSLTNVTFGSGVISIGNYAFEYCNSLTNVTLPASINSVGSYAFASCPDLMGAYFQGNAPSAPASAFSGSGVRNNTYAIIVYYLPGTTGWGQSYGGAPTALYNPPVPFNYSTNNGAITITQYTGAGGAVTIPATIYDVGASNFLPVISVGANAFAGCSGLISVSIPGGVTNLGSYAFADCTNLASVFFGSNAPAADQQTTFSNDSNASAYYLQRTTGWSSTFAGIPTVLPPYLYTAANGSITIQSYTGQGGSLKIPDTIGGLPIASIGSAAFYNCGSLTNVTIPNSVTNIGHGAFAGCSNLTSVTIPDNVNRIGICAFWNCASLTSVTLGANAVSVGISEFDSCASLTILTIPDTVITIGSSALQNCGSLTNVTIGKNVASIKNSALDSCSSLPAITVDPQNFNYGSVDGVLVNKSQNTLVQCPGGKAGSYTVPGTVTSIRNSAFHSCAQLTSITIPLNVISIGDWAFDSCSGLTNLTIPNIANLYIGSYAFASCSSLRNVTIPDSITTIGFHTFDGCTGLTDVTIGNGLNGIGSGNFSDCSSLTSIYLAGNPPYFTWNPTDEIATPTVYYLPGAPTNGIIGLPTALWLPRVQTGDATFGFQTNQFGFNISWASGRNVVVEACTNLANPVWTELGFYTITNGSIYFGDPQWTNYPGRFYRAGSSQ